MTLWIRRCPICWYANDPDAERCHCCLTLLTDENAEERRPGAREELA